MTKGREKITSETIRQTFRGIAQQTTPPAVQWGIVKSVDWEGKTCSVDVNGVEWPDVLLSMNGTKWNVLKPKTDALCLVCTLMNSEGWGALLWASDYEEHVLNGDAHGGLVIADKVTSRLNDVEQKLNTLIGIYNAHTHVSPPAPVNPVTTATPVAPMTRVAGSTVLKDLQNEVVKHG